MLNLGMALSAVNLVIGNMLLVHEYAVVDLLKFLWAVMAARAALLGDFAIAADDIAMAVCAVHAARKGQVMAEFHSAAQIKRFFGDLVATRTRPKPFIEVFILEVAQITGRCGYRHVASLNNLAVTTGAAQLHAIPQTSQVRSVVK